MDTRDFASKSMDEFDAVFSNVSEGELENSTPCIEWNVRELCNHVVNEVLWIPDLLEGKTIAEVGDKYDGDVLGFNPYESWTIAKEAALKAINDVDLEKTVYLSYGDFPAGRYIKEVSSDILIHTWDLTQGLIAERNLPEDLCEIAYDVIEPMQEMAVECGIYGEKVKAPEDSTWEIRLISLSGRRI